MLIQLLSIIAAVGVVGLVLALVFRRQLPQLFARARTLMPQESLSEKLGKHLDKQRLDVGKLESIMRAEEAEVVRLDGMVETQKSTLRKFAKDVSEAKGKYADGKSSRPNDEEFLDGLALAAKRAQTAYDNHRQLVAEFVKEAYEAHGALQETIELLQQRKQQLTSNEVKVALARAIELRNQAGEHFDAFKREAAAIDQNTAAIDQGLAEARARRQVNQGPAEDVELKRRQQRRDAAAAREALDAELEAGS